MTNREIQLIENLIDLKIENSFLQFSSRHSWEINNEIEGIKNELLKTDL